MVEGPSVSAMVKEADAALDAELAGKLDATIAAMEAMAKRAVDEARPYRSYFPLGAPDRD